VKKLLNSLAISSLSVIICPFTSNFSISDLDLLRLAASLRSSQERLGFFYVKIKIIRIVFLLTVPYHVTALQGSSLAILSPVFLRSSPTSIQNAS
jgi:hypothetical protein